MQCEAYRPLAVPFQSVAEVVYDFVRGLECRLVQTPVTNWVVVEVHISGQHRRQLCESTDLLPSHVSKQFKPLRYGMSGPNTVEHSDRQTKLAET